MLNHLSSLPSIEAKEDWLIHAYMDNGSVNEILDNGGLWNHSKDPNTGYGPSSDSDPNSSYAIRDIKKGEELLDDYGTY